LGHRQLAGLLSAIRKHSRKTAILEPSQHESLRAALDKRVSINVNETPLSSVIQDLEKQVGADIRLDKKTLSDIGFRERTPFTLKMNDQTLRTILRTLLMKRELSWMIRDNVVWITTEETIHASRKTAVFDVRDLSRDETEAEALKQAIESQSGGPWEMVDGEDGSISFPNPGCMVVTNSERYLDEVLPLLENYRIALRNSKPRKQQQVDPREVVTRYYRLPTRMATELKKAVPFFVKPETWKTDASPDAAGSIHLLPSRSELVSSKGNEVVSENSNSGIVVEKSVLVIRQTREIHKEISKFVSKLENGDPLDLDDEYIDPTKGGGGMGGGGGFGGGRELRGGFGGGFFSIK